MINHLINALQYFHFTYHRSMSVNSDINFIIWYKTYMSIFSCKRCLDPTDCGSLVSAMICDKCESEKTDKDNKQVHNDIIIFLIHRYVKNKKNIRNKLFVLKWFILIGLHRRLSFARWSDKCDSRNMVLQEVRL